MVPVTPTSSRKSSSCCAPAGVFGVLLNAQFTWGLLFNSKCVLGSADMLVVVPLKLSRIENPSPWVTPSGS